MDEKLVHPSWLDAYELEKDFKEEEGGEERPKKDGGLSCPGKEEGRLICD